MLHRVITLSLLILNPPPPPSHQVRKLKAEVRVSKRQEKAHAQTLAHAEHAAMNAKAALKDAAKAAAADDDHDGENGDGVGGGKDDVGSLSVEEKMELQDKIFALEVKSCVKKTRNICVDRW